MIPVTFPSLKDNPRLSGDSSPNNYVISYPNSGKRWLFSQLYTYKTGSFEFADSKVKPFLDKGKVIDTLHIKMLGSEWRKGRIVYLYRNPMATLTSFYYKYILSNSNHAKRMKKKGPSAFTHNKKHGFKIITNYNSFFYNKLNKHSVLFTSYENREKDLPEIIKFIGWEVDKQLIKKTIEKTSFDEAKKTQSKKNSIVRKGKKHSYVEDLSKEDIKYCIEHCKEERYPFSFDYYFPNDDTKYHYEGAV